ncbi:hypothetical protein LWI29_028004 [Acer saccharum]|uniref:Uncharacterized protein n=1 Tax=Acer saccharum TaxID=4024 RepID=A0AA39RRL2_ACESA|nr:hypothetical protein LWI29_028004 [Acer saccharum]
MFDFSSVKEPYEAVIEGKWEDLQEIFDNDEGFSISYPIMTVAKDNAFHIAVHSKSEQPLKHLLERLNHDQMRTDVLQTINAYENTVLHEAAINHNIAAVKLLVGGGYVTDEQLLERNKSGQTPLFKAAAFGSTKVVKYLASRPNQMMTTSDNYKQQLDDNHRTKKDTTSILHAAVLGEHFGIPTGDDNSDDADNIDEDHENDVKVADNISSEVISEYDDKVGDNQNKNAPPQSTLIFCKG